MLKWYKSLIIIGIALISTACSVTPTRSNYQQSVNTWIGSDVSQLARVWGYPDERIDLDNEQMIYVYRRETAQVMPGTRQPGQIETPGPGGSGYMSANSTPYNTYVKSCTTEFVVNKDYKIVNVLSSGNACQFTEGDKKDFAHESAAITTENK